MRALGRVLGYTLFGSSCLVGIGFFGLAIYLFYLLTVAFVRLGVPRQFSPSWAASSSACSSSGWICEGPRARRAETVSTITAPCGAGAYRAIPIAAREIASDG